MQRYFGDYVSLILIIIFFALVVRSCSDKKEHDGITSALYDTITKYKNKYGEEEAKRLVIVADNVSKLKELKSKDSLIIALQNRATSLSISLTALKNQTHINVGDTTHVVSRDTVVKDSVVYVYPEYRSAFTDKWMNYIIRSNKDSTFADIKVFNEFMIEQKYVKKGLFKPRDIEIIVTNKNPHTETIDVQSFIVHKKRGSGAVKAGIFILGLAAGIYVTK